MEFLTDETVAYREEIAELEALNDELLAALEELIAAPNKKRPDWVWVKAVEAIAKAKLER